MWISHEDLLSARIGFVVNWAFVVMKEPNGGWMVFWVCSH